MSRFALAVFASLAAVFIGAALGARGCEPEPVEVIELPAEFELLEDPRGPVRHVEPVDHDALVGRILRVTDELAEAAALLDGCD